MLTSWYIIKLKTYVSHLNNEENRKLEQEFHDKYHALPLKIILNLRGFYIKAGQVISSNPNILPEQYINSLRVLQKDVPPLPVREIKKIIESELGKKFSDIFKNFDNECIGAASIGQVHSARLVQNGKGVVIKIQYPEVEDFFEIDFRTTLFVLSWVDEGMVDIVKGIQGNFMKEFDYEREINNLKIMKERIEDEGVFKNVTFPKPKEEFCTRKVIVMEKIEGQTITEIGDRLFNEVARVSGYSKEDFKKLVKKSLRNPEKQQQFADSYSKLSTTMEKAVTYTRFGLNLRNYLHTLTSSLYNSTYILPYLFNGNLSPKLIFVPPSGPNLMTLLWNVHGYQIFEIGAFNSDPHSGNILVEEEGGGVGLIDYGQVCFLEEEWRVNFAKYIIAIDEENKEEVRRLWTDLGNEFIWKETGEVNPLNETFACALCHFGGPPGIVKGIKMLGFKSIRELKDVNEKIKITQCKPEYGMLQRCCFCLLGVAQQVGVFGQGCVPCKMLRPSAEKYLKSISK